MTQPSLPPLDEFTVYLKQIWESKTLTNGGIFHQKLEKALCEYLGVDYISLFNNGTTALITALQALNLQGEVITTPYSFIATANSLVWNNIDPVFVDIDSRTLNLDPSKIEAAITPRTSAIMPVHCYGYYCQVDEIQEIADRYKLKVIYDAAHAFGVKRNCESILKYGDLSVLSFHATKVFNTFEGGAIISSDIGTKEHIDRLKNFGFENELIVNYSGLNGKMSEINSAFGLVQLKHIQNALEARKKIDTHYRLNLNNVKGVKCHNPAGDASNNFSYFPIFIGKEYSLTRDELYQILMSENIYSRRYFYPLISEFSLYKRYPSAAPELLTNAIRASKEVLCLPIFPDLTQENQDFIISIIKKY